MVQHMQQGLHPCFVIALMSLANVVNNHVAHSLRAMLPGQQVLCKGCCNDLGYVFVVGNR